MMEQEVYAEAGRRVAQWRRVMILSHHRPDADALGSSAAIKRMLQATGHEVTAFVYERVAPRYAFIDAVCGFQLWQQEESAAIDRRFDGIVIVDTCSWPQLEPVSEFLRASRLPKVVLDHHATRDALTVANTDDYYAIDTTSASASGLVYEWGEAMGWPVDCAAGEVIFTGIAADTGWFRFSNTDGRTLRIVAAIIERCGVRPDILYARLNGSHSPARLRLSCEMLKTLQFHADGALAVMELTKPMFEQVQAAAGDAEELVNLPMDTGPVIVTVLLTDMGDGVVRVNFRSKSPELTGRDIDVSAIAGQFGGGGHRRAAGARVSGRLPEVREKVVQAVLQAMQ